MMSFRYIRSAALLRASGMAAAVLISVAIAAAELPLNAKPAMVELSGKCGGRLDGSPWSSSEIAGKVYSVYYIDPDEADLNEPLFTALKAEGYPIGKVQSVAIINMQATWMPAGVLSMVLKRKQKKYPLTLYIKDNCRKLVSAWDCTDHSSDIMLFNQQGEVLFSKDGQLTGDEIRTMIDLTWKHIGGKPANAAQN
ncbi:MAG: hypothetical protein JW863_08685 [Chitinispirillaceae bacterium]|nr:hypothetical protein [Chitinispirillaceae bacterium]